LNSTHIVICSLLVLLTLAVYAPVLHHRFVYFDDKEYVLENPHIQDGLTWNSVIWVATHAYAGNWHPLTWLSHMLDYELWGFNPEGHHLTSLALHTANTVLLFLLLAAATRATWRSAFVAALFAWHPLHVESVAWVSERKDVLCAFFWFLTISAYFWHLKRPHWSRYMVVVLCFMLALASKPMAVSLPFVLLLLDYWPLHRLELKTARSLWPELRPLLWEKTPLLLIAACSGLATFLIQSHAGALWSLNQLGLQMRFANAMVSYATYIVKLFWPADLAVFYPFRTSINPWELSGAVAFLAVVTIYAVVSARRFRFFPVGWLWFCGTLVPVIGIIQTGGQAMADRYSYIPLVGLLLVIAWGLPPADKARWLRVCLPVGASALLAASWCATACQLAYWRDNTTLFARAISVTSDNAFAYVNLAESLRDEGDLAGAATQLWVALRINPNYRQARQNLGALLLLQGRVDDAIVQLREAIRLFPDYAIAHNNLAEALMRQGKVEEAILHCHAALRIEPDLAEAQNNLAWIRATQENPKFRNAAEALRLASRAVELTRRRNPSILDTLAAALAENGRFDEAAEIARQAALLANSINQPAVAAAIAEHVQLFRGHQPYRTAR
jgi:tetratricopeptide (TPR) repeat protein